MNACELADELEHYLKGEEYDRLVWEIPDLLRQQALEIQALHQILGYEGIEVGQDYLDECVADLRKAQEK